VVAGLGDARDKAVKMQLIRPMKIDAIGKELFERTCAEFGHQRG